MDETAGGELGELLRSFNRMTAELGSTEMMRSDFISTFSHEFKTPIVSIRGGLRPAQQNEYLDFIAAESLRLSRLASGILLLSKYEAQNLVADQAPLRPGRTAARQRAAPGKPLGPARFDL